MNDIAIVIILILVCLLALFLLPKYFLKKNGKSASQKNFDEYVKDLLFLDKQLAPHAPSLSQNLNVVNYWLKTGYDPTAELTPEEQAEKERQRLRYERGDMTPTEAEEYRANKSKSRANFDIIDINENEKAKRLSNFSVSNLDPCDIGIESMDFIYDNEFTEHIYYCPTKEALKNKYYKNVIFMTTARPAQIPINYPNKYDGAQMLSLYKHPSHAVWFLKNWKTIRVAMEKKETVSVPEELEEAISDFDL